MLKPGNCFWVLMFFYILVNDLAAQTDGTDTLNWGDKKLEWSDFRGVAADYSPYPSELHCTIGYNAETCLIEGVKATALIAYCSMNRESSWVKKEAMNDQLLTYNQIQFDLAELYARKLQRQLFLLLNEKQDRQVRAFGLLLDINLECRQRVDKLMEQTSYGDDTDEVKIWAQAVARELEQTPKLKIPVFEYKKFAIGGSFDLGAGLLSRPLNQYFSNNFNLAFGFDAGYRNLIFYLRGILGFNSVKNDFVYKNKMWPGKLSTGLASGDITVGYPLVDNRKSRITPFTGVGYFEFSPTGHEHKYEDQRIGKAGYTVGLNYDYKVITTMNLFSRSNEKADWFIRTRISASFVNFSDQIKGAVINFTVGLGGWVRFLRII